MELVVTPHGQMRCLYEEAFELAALGRIEIARASHVEPDAGGQWWAQLEPVGGPILGRFVDVVQHSRPNMLGSWPIGSLRLRTDCREISASCFSHGRCTLATVLILRAADAAGRSIYV